MKFNNCKFTANQQNMGEHLTINNNSITISSQEQLKEVITSLPKEAKEAIRQEMPEKDAEIGESFKIETGNRIKDHLIRLGWSISSSITAAAIYDLACSIPF